MSWVFDTSVALAWCFPDEKTERTEALLDRLAEEPAIVPQHWSLEVSNVLLGALRKGRISQKQATHFLGVLRTVTLHTDPLTDELALTTTMALAQKHGLTSYDAAYLELAKRMGVPLATSDEPLRRAAEAEGVDLL